jgi:hypothetical protein
MAGTEQVITHFSMPFLWMYFFLTGGNALVPVATVEKGFVPSSAWPGESFNVSAVHKEAQ